MPRGTVKWFNNAKGFGFILPDDGSGDLFAHYSSIEVEGYRTLKAGQTVTFEVSNGQKGLYASHIKHEQNQDITKTSPQTHPSESRYDSTPELKDASSSANKMQSRPAVLEELH